MRYPMMMAALLLAAGPLAAQQPAARTETLEQERERARDESGAAVPEPARERTEERARERTDARGDEALERLGRKHEVSREELRRLEREERLSPYDIGQALSIAEHAKKPLAEVLGQRRAGQSWSDISQRYQLDQDRVRREAREFEREARRAGLGGGERRQDRLERRDRTRDRDHDRMMQERHDRMMQERHDRMQERREERRETPNR